MPHRLSSLRALAFALLIPLTLLHCASGAESEAEAPPTSASQGGSAGTKTGDGGTKSNSFPEGTSTPFPGSPGGSAGAQAGSGQAGSEQASSGQAGASGSDAGSAGAGGEAAGSGGAGGGGAGGAAGAGAGQSGASGAGPVFCGDGQCNGEETCTNCPGDCGACPVSCGNGVCDVQETCGTCAADCGACAPICGDGKCNGSESCSTCASDCGSCQPFCGDGKCNGNETCVFCSPDCGACPPEVCNDGVDNDKDGQVDEGCKTEITVSPKPSDDCVCLECPPDFPFVKSCSLSFKSGGDDSSSNSNCFEQRNQSTVYAMQGKNCGTSSDPQGKVTGSIVCSKSPGGSCNVSGAISCQDWSAASLKDSYKNCK